jgi:hypothetical protein
MFTLHFIVDLFEPFCACITICKLSMTDLFEQRIIHGISMWHCVHDGVAAYVARVLANAQPLLTAVSDTKRNNTKSTA